MATRKHNNWEEFLDKVLPKSTDLEKSIKTLFELTEFDSAVLCLKYEGDCYVPGTLNDALKVAKAASKQGINVSLKEIVCLIKDGAEVKGYHLVVE